MNGKNTYSYWFYLIGAYNTCGHVLWANKYILGVAYEAFSAYGYVFMYIV